MNIAHGLITRSLSAAALPAITDGDRTVTFGALVDRMQRLSGSLMSKYGLAKGDRVVVYSENCAEFLEVMFAAWNAGLCVVPVNAKLHPKEVAHIIENSGARMVAASVGHAESLAQEIAPAAQLLPILVLGSDAYELLALGDRLPCAEVSSSDFAWIFYTSGTTGKPKGAVISHQSLQTMALTYHADIGRVVVGDTQLHAAPLSHASGLYALPHLFAGGHQVVLDGFDTEEILGLFKTMPRVSMFAAPTMLLRLQRAAAGIENCAANLEAIIYGGGPMYVADLESCLATFGPRLYQLYGQGECPMTISGLTREAHVGMDTSRRARVLASCGLPRTGVRVRVVDEAGTDVATDEPGEIVVSSQAMMSGYWNNPEATAKAVRDGWLWTGDIGSLSADGLLTLRDRSKDLIISGGTNIYPREIEEVLLTHPAVMECSVIGLADPEWGEVPVAFVVQRDGESVAVNELDALCVDRIARFKRPRHYRFIESLPKNSYGKVLKTELRVLLTRVEKLHA